MPCFPPPPAKPPRRPRLPSTAEVNTDKCAESWARALDAIRAALTAAKDFEAKDAEAGNIKTGVSGTVTHLQRELRRYKEADKGAQEAVAKANAQALRDAEAAKRRAKGLEQTPSNNETSIISKPTIGYVRDIDLSVFATTWLGNEIIKLEHKFANGSVKVDQLDKNQSEIHASIKEKRGKRALYYDMTLVFNWTGTSEASPNPFPPLLSCSHLSISPPLASSPLSHSPPLPLPSGKSKLGRSNHGEMQGIMKMYNVGQDTKFELGGDKETSYMFELGFHPKYHGECEPWATSIKSECSDLFELVSKLIIEKMVPAISSKGELVK